MPKITVVSRHRRQKAHKARLARQGTPKCAARKRLPVLNDNKIDVDLTTPIEDLDLTVRTYNILRREGVRTLGDLVDHTEAMLMDYRGFGGKCLDDVKDKLPAGASLKE